MSSSSELYHIGLRANEFGKSYVEQGDLELGKDYKEFATGVLYSAYQLDSLNTDVIAQIIEVTDDIGDNETAELFRKKLK